MLATNGYIQIWVGKSHHLADGKGIAYEHRVVAEANPPIACECGCGQTFQKFDGSGRPRHFVSGHNPEASPLQDSILALFGGDQDQAISIAQVSAATGRSQDAASTTLYRMTRAGRLVKSGRGLFKKSCH